MAMLRTLRTDGTRSIKPLGILTKGERDALRFAMDRDEMVILYEVLPSNGEAWGRCKPADFEATWQRLCEGARSPDVEMN